MQKLNKLFKMITMVASFKLEQEQWRLETDMNMPPVDTNYQFRILRNRNIPCDTRHRQIDRQTSRGQKSDISPRSSSLKICSTVIPGISMRLPSTPDNTIGNTFKQDSLKLPIPTPRYERYTQQNP